MCTALFLASLTVSIPTGAQVFNGEGLEGGVNTAATIQGPINQPLRTTIVLLLGEILSYIALAAVVVIIIAGVYLILGLGSDDSKNKAKTIIMYVIIGLIIILVAQFLVGIFTIDLPSHV